MTDFSLDQTEEACLLVYNQMVIDVVCAWIEQDSFLMNMLLPNHPSNRSSKRPQKIPIWQPNACKGFWSECLQYPLQTSPENSCHVKTGYLEERNGGQIHFLEKTSFVLICKLPGLFLKHPCLKVVNEDNLPVEARSERWVFGLYVVYKKKLKW